MEYITYIGRLVSFVMLLLFFSGCHAQQAKETDINSLYGRWKTVKHDYRGFQRLNSEQAERLRQSTLVIEKGKVYFENINFIEPCVFSEFSIRRYDTTEYLENYGYGHIEDMYSLEELKTLFFLVTPVNENGEYACIDIDIWCNIFYLKQDTLINECGGYKFFWVKETTKTNAQAYSGTGSTTKLLSLTGKETTFKLSYEFYKEPDELIVYDQNGKELHRTGMRATTETVMKNINIYDVTQLLFKIESKESNSKWKFSVTVE